MEFYYQNASNTGATFALPLLGTQSKRYINLVMSYMDLAGTLAFLVVVVTFSAFQAHVLREVRDKTVTISDYSLQVWALPKVRSRDPGIWWCPSIWCCQVSGAACLNVGPCTGQPA